MFEVEMERASTLKKIINALTGLLDEAAFKCTPNGITLSELDPSHVALVSMKLSPQFFQEYYCDENVKLGMNLSKISKALKSASKDDICILRHDDQVPEFVTLTFYDIHHPLESMVKTMKLLDIEDDEKVISDQKHSLTIEMSSSEFATICDRISECALNIEITAIPNGGVTISGKDYNYTTTFSVQYNVQKPGTSSTTFQIREKVNSTLAISYLHKFAKAASAISDRVRLSISDDIPMMAEYKINEKDEDNGYIRYYLAPKINDDGEIDL